MKTPNRVLILTILAIAAFFLLRSIYYAFTPIVFLFSLTIGLILMYANILYTSFKRSQYQIDNGVRFHAKLLSVFFLLILFSFSIIVIHDYQKPSGKNAYFSNIDHHVIKNYGVGFNNAIVLYDNPLRSSIGLWPSESGSLKLVYNNGKYSLEEKDLYQPIFKSFKVGDKDSVQLINRLFSKNVSSGFCLKDKHNSLTWLKIEKGKKKSRYTMRLLFESSDPLVFDADSGKTFIWKDTITLSDISISRGLDLQYLLQRGSRTGAAGNLGAVSRWLAQFQPIYLIKENMTDSAGFSLFPGNDFFINGKAYLHEKILTANTKNEIAIDSNQHFFIGLSGLKNLLTIRRALPREAKESLAFQHVLEFNEQKLLPFYVLPDGSHTPGNNEVRFIRNNITAGDLASGLREGFLFHTDMMSNANTEVFGILEAKVDNTGQPLDWHVYGANSTASKIIGIDSFLLASKNSKLQWLYTARDLSANDFDFSHLRIYFSLILFSLVVLVVYRPGNSTVFLEAPIWMIIYTMIVFRMLVLWRVASFPPLENISSSEFKTLQSFDLKYALLGLPFSIWTVLFFAFLLFSYRSQYTSKFLPRIQKRILSLEKLNSSIWLGYWMHLSILIVCLVSFYFGNDLVKRITAILIPVLSYLYFSYIYLRSNVKIFYRHIETVKTFQPLYAVLTNMVETPLFFLTATTLVYLGVTDKGFAVLFLLFILFKNFLFNLYRLPKKPTHSKIRNLLSPYNFGILGFIALMLFGVFIAKKSFIHQLLVYKYLVLAIILLFFPIYYWVKAKPTRINRIIICLLLLLPVPLLFSGVRSGIDKRIEDRIKAVKYRAPIIYQPLEDIILDYPYSSGQEEKIIETAQSQWFINSYISNPPVIKGSNDPLIQFKPHFKTGVDYVTQTRDVVVARYVIGEFGSLAMMLILVLLAIPLFLFFVFHKINFIRISQFDAPTATGAMAVILLFILALFVWMTSTNRFVFFGQDFPFLSLTSRISLLLPLSLFFIVLALHPQVRSNEGSPIRGHVQRWAAFALLISITILGAGKSDRLTKENFEIEFANAEKHIDQDVAAMLSKVQEKKRRVIDITNKKDFIKTIRDVLKDLYATPEFSNFRNDSLSAYERSIIDSLRVNPLIGLQLNSPVHFKVRDNQLSIHFNRSWRLELPAYDYKKQWKGDLLENEENLVLTPDQLWPIKSPGLNVLLLPASYLKEGQTAIGLVDMEGSDKDTAIIFNPADRVFRHVAPASFVQCIKDQDLLLSANSGSIQSIGMSSRKKNYFAYGLQLNGRQRHIYPLGSRLFWARQWTEVVADLYKKSPDSLNANSHITLDYSLNKEVGNYLHRSLPNMALSMQHLSFSVIAADGNGNIRLMQDYVRQREGIDPNDEEAVTKKMQSQYFMVDNEAERIQWGNQNLLRMTMGPGSSMKPILAASIGAQLKLEWEKLVYLKANNDNQAVNSQNEIIKYAKLELRNPWEIEAGNNVETDFKKYLYNSNNLYHSLLVFLGSYKKEDFSAEGKPSLKNVLKPFVANNGNDQFPILSIDDKKFVLPDTNNWPKTDIDPSYFGHPSSLFATALAHKMKLRNQSSRSSGKTESRYNFSKFSDTLANRHVWPFPESSYFMQEQRKSLNIQDNFNKAVRNTTLGAGIMEITPFKMAEMYGKLTSKNESFELSIQEQKSKPGEWNWDKSSWESISDYEQFHYGAVFGAMKDVINSGTLISLKSLFAQYPAYHFYAKTGTIGLKNSSRNSKRLALIVSKNELKSSKDAGKFFVIYFTIGDARGDNAPNWFNETYMEVIKRIISSKSFQDYMK